MKKTFLLLALSAASKFLCAQWLHSGAAVADVNACQIIGTNKWAAGNKGNLYTVSNADTIKSMKISESDLHALKFISQYLGFITDDSGNVFTTKDGGRSWTRNFHDGTRYFNSIDFSAEDRNIGYLAYQSGYYFTKDFGNTWNGPIDLKLTVSKIKVLNNTTAYIAGNKENRVGKILKTENSGESWISSEFNTVTFLNDIHFISSQTGWACGAGGSILKTTDSGSSWKLIRTNTQATLNGIYFKNDNIGFTVGNGGTILLSKDGGNNWEQQRSGTTEDLFDIDISADGNYAMITGRNGLILYSNTGGLTPVNGFKLKTRSEKQTVTLEWQTLTEYDNKAFEIQRFDGKDWLTLETLESKGNSELPTDYSYTDLHPANGKNVYRVNQLGNKGTIDFSETITVLAEKPEYYLQLFPNPASGSLTVQYSLPSSGLVNLQLIGSNGSLIRKIVSAKQASGTYTVILPLNDIAPGTYFVQLQTSGASSVSKILYVR